MTSRLSIYKTGMTFGGVAAFLHVLWSLLVALGGAEYMLNFVFALHFLDNPHTVGSFNIVQACFLVLIAGVIGYGVGSIFAFFWNIVHTPD
ncbi:MAG: hypothetical protein Q7R79_04180 [bacterium]|nr:hypothetical protein [bacterium]